MDVSQIARERIREIRAVSATIYIYIYIYEMCLGEYICVHRYIKKLPPNVENEILFSLSSSSCHAIRTDIPDPLLPPIPIVHRFR